MEYQIKDHETGNIYVFNLTEEEYLRASKDLVYCTQLLEKAKENENNEDIEHQETQFDNEVYNDNFRWAEEPTRLLLATYKQHEYLLHTGKLSVKKFWEMVSNKLKEKGYDVTGQQCKSKINGLKRTYKNIKDYNNKNGNNRQTWPYFEIMDDMFGQKPSVTPILTLDSSNKNILSSASPTSSNGSNISGEKVTQDTMLDKLLVIMEENKKERKKMHNEAMERQDRMLNILEKIVNKYILSSASPTSSNGSNISGNTYNEISSSPQFSKSSRKRQKLTEDIMLDKLLVVMEENKEERKKMHNEAMERQDQMLNNLEKIVNE